MGNVLDFSVAQAVARARQIERALHDNGPWEISYGALVQPAVRMIFDDRVVFLAHFPAHCWIAPPDAAMSLICKGEVCSVRHLNTHPGDGEWEAEWVFAMEQPATV